MESPKPSEKRRSRGFKPIVYALSIAVGLMITVYGVSTGLRGFDLRLLLLAALDIAVAPMAFFYTMTYRRIRLIDDMLPVLLDDLADLQDAGLNFIQAFEVCSSRNYGPLTKPLKKAVVLLSWGVEFESAMKKFAEEAGTENVRIVSAILSAAIRVGGDIKPVFRSLASFIREVESLNRERSSRVRPYIMIIYTTVFILLFTMWLIYTQFIASTGLPIPLGATAKTIMSVETYRTIAIDLAAFESVFSGLIAGKLEGTVKLGFKHILILLTVAIVFMALLF